MDDAMINFNTATACIYFVSFVIFGNFILVNLFLGIIVDTLVSDYEENITIEDELNTEENLNNLTLKNIERLAKLHQKSEKMSIKKTIKSNLKSTKKQPDNEKKNTVIDGDGNLIMKSSGISFPSTCLSKHGGTIDSGNNEMEHTDNITISSTPEPISKGTVPNMSFII